MSGCTSDDTTWERIESTKVLRIGLDPTYPPFELADEHDLWGLDVDLGNALADELGLSVEFTYFGYDGLYDALGTNQVDTLLSALVIAPERTKDYSYSSSYFNAGQVLVTTEDNKIDDPTELEGKIVSVELGAQGHVLATRLQRELRSLDIITESSSDIALDAVTQRKVDAAIVDHITARLHRIDEPSLMISDHIFLDEPFALVVRSEDSKLLNQLNMALKNLESSGQLNTIISAWLDKK